MSKELTWPASPRTKTNVRRPYHFTRAITIQTRETRSSRRINIKKGSPSPEGEIRKQCRVRDRLEAFSMGPSCLNAGLNGARCNLFNLRDLTFASCRDCAANCSQVTLRIITVCGEFFAPNCNILTHCAPHSPRSACSQGPHIFGVTGKLCTMRTYAQLIKYS